MYSIYLLVLPDIAAAAQLVLHERSVVYGGEIVHNKLIKLITKLTFENIVSHRYRIGIVEKIASYRIDKYFCIVSPLATTWQHLNTFLKDVDVETVKATKLLHG